MKLTKPSHSQMYLKCLFDRYFANKFEVLLSIHKSHE